VEIFVKPRNGNHPFIEGDYKTCSTIQHQVSVKNYNSQKEIEDVLEMLHSRSGRKITKITTPVLTDTPSIQGVWTPFLNLVHEQPKITMHQAAEE
jgi:large subunit ribosomal protein L43